LRLFAPVDEFSAVWEEIRAGMSATISAILISPELRMSSAFKDCIGTEEMTFGSAGILEPVTTISSISPDWASETAGTDNAAEIAAATAALGKLGRLE
jgi:hypothetical protein